MSKGWANDVSKEKLENWREDALELKQELEDHVLEKFSETYYSLMRKVVVYSFLFRNRVNFIYCSGLV